MRKRKSPAKHECKKQSGTLVEFVPDFSTRVLTNSETEIGLVLYSNENTIYAFVGSVVLPFNIIELFTINCPYCSLNRR